MAVVHAQFARSVPIVLVAPRKLHVGRIATQHQLDRPIPTSVFVMKDILVQAAFARFARRTITVQAVQLKSHAEATVAQQRVEPLLTINVYVTRDILDPKVSVPCAQKANIARAERMPPIVHPTVARPTRAPRLSISAHAILDIFLPVDPIPALFVQKALSARTVYNNHALATAPLHPQVPHPFPNVSAIQDSPRTPHRQAVSP